MPRGAAPRGARLPGGVPISPEKWGERGEGGKPQGDQVTGLYLTGPTNLVAKGEIFDGELVLP